MGKQFRPGLRSSLRFQMDFGVRHIPVLHLKFGENHGDVAYDSSPYGNNGDIEGPSWTKGVLGPALSFDGLDDYVAIPDSSTVDITSAPLSIFAWIRLAADAGSGWVVVKNLDGIENVQYGLLWWQPDNNLGVRLQGVMRTWSAVNSVLTGAWYHVGFTWDGSSVPTYVNGIQSGGAGTYTGALTSRPYLRVGRREPATAYFKGIIDEPRIYSRALTAREVLELYYGVE